MRFLFSLTILLSAISPGLRAEDPAEDWAYQPYKKPAVPKSVKSERIRNPIDAFVLARLNDSKLAFAPDADKATLLRRVTFDLTGLPPTPAELDGFLKDTSKDAYLKVVERLLKSPRYGEKAALPWLDLVRYAESDGFKADDYRPNAWRYRDYVVDSLNADKPYDRFVQEQLAGDELFPQDPAALVATGFLRHYQEEYNAINLEQKRQDTLNDLTDVAGQAFLGLTLGCAKCHDHKFDPITQVDYYRIQAFFAGYSPVSVSILNRAEKAKLEADRKAWEEKTAAIRQQIEEVVKSYREKFYSKRQKRFPDEYGKLVLIPEEKRDPWQKQIAAMVMKQINDEKGMMATVTGADKEKLDKLQEELKKFGPAPSATSEAVGMTDIGTVAPVVHRLKRGNVSLKAEEVEPGYLSAIDDRTADIEKPLDGKTTGRRSTLAHWLTQKENPLTARVQVNRVWQQLFGFGLVRTPADFGTQGDRPTHPELLDWLACEFVERGWSIKQIHKLILTSTTYMQQSRGSDKALEADPENRLLAHQNRKRLEGETLRDSILAASGLLNLKAGGPSIYPDLPAELKGLKWVPSKDEAERNRRSIYVAVRRNVPFPMFSTFDGTDRCEACSKRFVTNTASQALSLLNEKQIVKQAEAFAKRLTKEAGEEPAKQIDLAFQLALGRLPKDSERTVAIKFLQKQPLVDLCHALLNLNEFVYLD